MALTFDDGPSHYRTQTLRTLRRTHVPATFFDVGMRVAANPQFAQFEAREGHLVLNHTWSHPHLPTLTPAQVRRQVLRTQRVLRKAGAPMPFKLLRPPFGDVDAAVDAQLTRLGYHHVNWDVVATDWDVATTSAEIRDTIVKAFRPGLVILMHDGAIDSANGPADEAALPQVIQRAEAARLLLRPAERGRSGRSREAPAVAGPDPRGHQPGPLSAPAVVQPGPAPPEAVRHRRPGLPALRGRAVNSSHRTLRPSIAWAASGTVALGLVVTATAPAATASGDGGGGGASGARTAPRWVAPGRAARPRAGRSRTRLSRRTRG